MIIGVELIVVFRGGSLSGINTGFPSLSLRFDSRV